MAGDRPTQKDGPLENPLVVADGIRAYDKWLNLNPNDLGYQNPANLVKMIYRAVQDSAIHGSSEGPLIVSSLCTSPPARPGGTQ